MAKHGKSKNNNIFNVDKALEKGYIALPLSFAIIAILTIIRAGIAYPDVDTATAFGSNVLVSYFSYTKYQLLLFSAGFILIFSLVAFKIFSIPKDKYLRIYLVACGIYLIFTIISAMTADFNTTMQGYYDQYEGLWTLISYAVLFLYTIFVYLKIKDYRYIIIPLIVVIAINFAGGTYEVFAGTPFHSLQFVKELIFPASLEEQMYTIDLALTTGIGTFGNSNFLSAFSALTTPLFTFLAISEKKLSLRITYAITAFMAICLLYFSAASSGIIGYAVMIALLAIIIIRQMLVDKQSRKLLAIGSISSVLLMTVLNFAFGNPFSAAITPIIDGAKVILSDTSDVDVTESNFIKNITFENKNCYIKLQGGTLEIEYDRAMFLYFDENDNELVPNISDGVVTFSEEFTQGLVLNMHKVDAPQIAVDTLEIFGNGVPYGFIGGMDPEGMFYRNPYTLALWEMDYPESWLFNGKEQIGSNRGYIWAHTLPMISESLILGVGPDNYAFHFPNFDVVGKVASGIPLTTLFTKPHNLFLQTLINNGGIAFLAMMVIFVLYAIESLKLYIAKGIKFNEHGMGIALFVSVMSYLGAGMFNDSSIVISPLFWIMLGLGIAVNYKARKSLEVTDK